ncbi:MAG: RluA family pseudouridine synthase, partial [Cryobacterium sp.]|nr:RluA family pseudouridine synthase [Oligoflexia bacterium]
MARLKILFRDRDLIVIHKPSGMKTYRDSKKETELSAYDVLKKQFVEAQIYPVHRLDRGTCGLLIFALKPDVANLMQKAFREEKVRKTYWALVWGDPSARGEWKKPLEAKEKEKDGEKDARGGTQRALTKFRTRGRFETDSGEEGVSGRKFSWIECEPKTGRLHQIRRHASEAGFPLVGDDEYSTAELKKASAEFKLKRIALSAIRLEFM